MRTVHTGIMARAKTTMPRRAAGRATSAASRKMPPATSASGLVNTPSAQGSAPSSGRPRASSARPPMVKHMASRKGACPHARYTTMTAAKVQAARGNPFDEGENLLYELFDLEFLLLEQESFAYHVGDAGEPGQAEGFALGHCLATTLYPSLPRCPALAASFDAAMPAEAELRQ